MEAASGLADLATAVGLVFVIEGMMLALFPERLQRMLADLLTKPPQLLRLGGLLSVAFGVVLVWLVRG